MSPVRSVGPVGTDSPEVDLATGATAVHPKPVAWQSHYEDSDALHDPDDGFIEWLERWRDTRVPTAEPGGAEHTPLLDTPQ